MRFRSYTGILKTRVIADASRIGQAITNYLTNALKYAPVDRVVLVRLEVTGTVARVSVHDQGPGLTPEQQQWVWERFYCRWRWPLTP